jgi:hypothetical protein
MKTIAGVVVLVLIAFGASRISRGGQVSKGAGCQIPGTFGSFKNGDSTSLTFETDRGVIRVVDAKSCADGKVIVWVYAQRQ